MDVATKLSILADAAKYDASCASSGGEKRSSKGGNGIGSTTGNGICHSYTPDGRCVSLLKILLTNYCVYDCLYCVNRVSSGVRRARFTVDEVIGLTLDFYRRNYIEGLFLSSGVAKSPDATMEELVAVARRLREEHDFRGYVHLKTLPEVSPELVAEAGRFADRVSINVELPTVRDLAELAPEKSLPRIRQAMRRLRVRIDEAKAERRRSANAPPFAPAGQSTQMVVGASATTDAEILATASELYREERLRRIYYSAFSPIPDASSKLPLVAPPLVREHRLYQADWLVRFYGFEAGELTSERERNLDLTLDPKLAWAMRHPERFPVDVNGAAREELLRVPGLGVRSVERILRSRRWRRIGVAELERLRVPIRKVLPFVVLDGHTPARAKLEGPAAERRIVAVERQLSLFEASATALSGEI